MADDVLTDQEFEAWLTPSAALTLLTAAFKPEDAKILISERLYAGVITAITPTFSRSQGGVPPVVSSKRSIIPAHHFDDLETDEDFWRLGQTKFYMTGSRIEGATITFRCFDVRLEPLPIQALLPTATTNPKTKIGEKIVGPVPELNAPPVSDSHLQAWYDLYSKVYTGPSDTEAMAMTSAEGMFQGKSVSRDKVRKLRGPQGRGRKPLLKPG